MYRYFNSKSSLYVDRVLYLRFLVAFISHF